MICTIECLGQITELRRRCVSMIHTKIDVRNLALPLANTWGLKYLPFTSFLNRRFVLVILFQTINLKAIQNGIFFVCISLYVQQILSSYKKSRDIVCQKHYFGKKLIYNPFSFSSSTECRRARVPISLSYF